MCLRLDAQQADLLKNLLQGSAEAERDAAQLFWQPHDAELKQKLLDKAAAYEAIAKQIEECSREKSDSNQKLKTKHPEVAVANPHAIYEEWGF